MGYLPESVIIYTYQKLHALTPEGGWADDPPQEFLITGLFQIKNIIGEILTRTGEPLGEDKN